MAAVLEKRREVALARARRGAAFLDKKLGRNWRRKVRRQKLDMAIGTFPSRDGCGCIIAQLKGDYSDGIESLGVRIFSQRSATLGFTVGRSRDLQYTDLTHAWKQVIREGLS